jgi:acetyltransferase
MASALHARTYPADTVEVRSLADGRPLILRPIGAADAALLQDFVRSLSPASRRLRFQTGLNELYPALLAQLTRIDHLEHAAFAAVIYERGVERMIGEARYAPSGEGDGSSEFAIAVADEWQHKGLGLALTEKLLRHARDSGIERIHGDVLQENTGMLRLARMLGFRMCLHPDGAWLARATLDLRAADCLPPLSPQPSSAAAVPQEAVRP